MRDGQGEEEILGAGHANGGQAQALIAAPAQFSATAISSLWSAFFQSNDQFFLLFVSVLILLGYCHALLFIFLIENKKNLDLVY